MTIKKVDVMKMIMAARAAGLVVERLEADFRTDRIIVHVERADPEQIAALNGRDPDHHALTPTPEADPTPQTTTTEA